MAHDTDISLRNKLIYCVFVRNHTSEGTFKALIPDLKRIKDMGTDILWLLPINPIGEQDRKGSAGSPYAIQDYRGINPEYGSKEDFVEFVNQSHALGMKVMMDIVYNHTSPDSVLKKEHPEWFLQDSKGSFVNKVADWTDVSDLDYSKHALWKYQIDTLVYWAKIVDGFRCDVAPLVPIDFWIEARKQVAKVNPDCIWLAESTGDGFIRDLRNQDYWASTDGELYEAFDITYDYDISDEFHGFLNNNLSTFDFANTLNHQDVAYPANYVKMRFLENHDNDRAHSLISNLNDLYNWTAFSVLEKGIALIYDGEEYGATHTPSLFEKDPIIKSEKVDLVSFIKKLKEIKSDPICAVGNYMVNAFDNDLVTLTYKKNRKQLIGIFSLNSNKGTVKVSLPDGNYVDKLTGQTVKIKRGLVQSEGNPLVIMSE